MFSYLEKFKKLPKELREVVSSPQAVKVINELEDKYGIELDALVIKVMVKEVSWPGLANYLVREHHLSQEQAEQLQQEMAEKVFSEVTRYLGIALTPLPAVATALQAGSPSPTPDVPETSLGTSVGDGDKMTSKEKEETKEIEEADLPSLQDTPELRQASKKLDELGIDKNSYSSINEAVDALMPGVIAIAGLKQEQTIQVVRLKNIIKTFMKGIRDLLVTREALMKPRESGGLALEREQAERIVNIMKEKKEMFSESSATKKSKAVTLPLDSIDQIRDVEYDFSALTPDPSPTPDVAGEGSDKTERKKIGTHSFSKEELEHELAPPPPVRSQKSEFGIRKSTPLSDEAGQAEEEKKFVISPEKVKEAERQLEEDRLVRHSPEVLRDEGGVQVKPKEEKPDVQKVRVERPPVADQDRPRMDDILKPPTRLQGPIEELANLDLVNFRRLGDIPEIIINKIKNKISLLEEESFTKRQQGINAWRHSPIYKIYIDLGQESMREGRPVEELIKEKSTRDKNILTAEEFNAIMDLNKQLRV